MELSNFYTPQRPNVPACDQQILVGHNFSQSRSDMKSSQSSQEDVSENEASAPSQDTSCGHVLHGDGPALPSEQTRSVIKQYDRQSEETYNMRKQSPLYHVRNYNNWVKSVIIRIFVGELANTTQSSDRQTGLAVLDMCCGKGGDIQKWFVSGASRLFFVDISHACIGECRRRFSKLRRNFINSHSLKRNAIRYDFKVADCSRTRLIDEWPSLRDGGPCHIVSVQFALHYAFESLQQASMMLHNVADSLCTGGYFICTIPNAFELMKRLRCAGENALEFGNTLYSLRMYDHYSSENVPPLFGASYNFCLNGMIDCPEFIVYVPLLCRLAQDVGLRLVFSCPFDEFFDDFSDIQLHRDLLFKVNAFRSMNIHGNVPNTNCYTLSVEEWEVCTFYIALAFIKE